MPRAGLSRDAVVDAAVRLVEASGLEGLTLARLASDLGVRPPSLYKHVGGLPDLQSAVAGRAASALTRGLEEAALARGGERAIRAIAHFFRRFATQRPRLYEVTVASHVHQPPEAREAMERALVVLLRAFGDLGLQGDARVHAARTFRAAVHGFAHLEARGGFGLDTDVDASFDWMLDTLFEGVRHADHD